MKCPNCNVDILPSRNNHKTIIQLNEYINQVKNGEKSIMLGKEFVVLSTDEYSKLVDRKKKLEDRVEVSLENMFLKEKALKGKMVRFKFDHVEVELNGDIVYVEKLWTIDGYPNGKNIKFADELVTEEKAKELAKNYLQNELNKMKVE